VSETGDGALIIDDAHLLMGNGACEQALFHLLNQVHGSKGRLMLTGDVPPARWPVSLGDLRSRLGAIPVAEIGLPDDGLMAALLIKLFADRQIHVAADVIRYLAARMERSFEAASLVVAAIDRRALAAGRAVTIPLVRDVLAESG
jgi:chromosomal replication initiation ATPase DnaA